MKKFILEFPEGSITLDPSLLLDLKSKNINILKIEIGNKIYEIPFQKIWDNVSKFLSTSEIPFEPSLKEIFDNYPILKDKNISSFLSSPTLKEFISYVAQYKPIPDSISQKLKSEFYSISPKIDSLFTSLKSELHQLDEQITGKIPQYRFLDIEKVSKPLKAELPKPEEVIEQTLKIFKPEKDLEELFKKRIKIGEDIKILEGFKKTFERAINFVDEYNSYFKRDKFFSELFVGAKNTFNILKERGQLIPFIRRFSLPTPYLPGLKERAETNRLNDLDVLWIFANTDVLLKPQTFWQKVGSQLPSNLPWITEFTISMGLGYLTSGSIPVVSDLLTREATSALVGSIYNFALSVPFVSLENIIKTAEKVPEVKLTEEGKLAIDYITEEHLSPALREQFIASMTEGMGWLVETTIGFPFKKMLLPIVKEGLVKIGGNNLVKNLAKIGKFIPLTAANVKGFVRWTGFQGLVGEYGEEVLEEIARYITEGKPPPLRDPKEELATATSILIQSILLGVPNQIASVVSKQKTEKLVDINNLMVPAYFHLVNKNLTAQKREDMINLPQAFNEIREMRNKGEDIWKLLPEIEKGRILKGKDYANIEYFIPYAYNIKPQNIDFVSLKNNPEFKNFYKNILSPVLEKVYNNKKILYAPVGSVIALQLLKEEDRIKLGNFLVENLKIDDTKLLNYKKAIRDKLIKEENLIPEVADILLSNPEIDLEIKKSIAKYLPETLEELYSRITIRPEFQEVRRINEFIRLPTNKLYQVNFSKEGKSPFVGILNRVEYNPETKQFYFYFEEQQIPHSLIRDIKSIEIPEKVFSYIALEKFNVGERVKIRFREAEGVRELMGFIDKKSRTSKGKIKVKVKSAENETFTIDLEDILDIEKIEYPYPLKKHNNLILNEEYDIDYITPQKELKRERLKLIKKEIREIKVGNTKQAVYNFVFRDEQGREKVISDYNIFNVTPIRQKYIDKAIYKGQVVDILGYYPDRKSYYIQLPDNTTTVVLEEDLMPYKPIVLSNEIELPKWVKKTDITFEYKLLDKVLNIQLVIIPFEVAKRGSSYLITQQTEENVKSIDLNPEYPLDILQPRTTDLSFWQKKINDYIPIFQSDLILGHYGVLEKGFPLFIKIGDRLYNLSSNFRMALLQFFKENPNKEIAEKNYFEPLRKLAQKLNLEFDEKNEIPVYFLSTPLTAEELKDIAYKLNISLEKFLEIEENTNLLSDYFVNNPKVLELVDHNISLEEQGVFLENVWRFLKDIYKENPVFLERIYDIERNKFTQEGIELIRNALLQYIFGLKGTIENINNLIEANQPIKFFHIYTAVVDNIPQLIYFKLHYPEYISIFLTTLNSFVTQVRFYWDKKTIDKAKIRAEIRDLFKDIDINLMNILTENFGSEHFNLKLREYLLINSHLMGGKIAEQKSKLEYPNLLDIEIEKVTERIASVIEKVRNDKKRVILQPQETERIIGTNLIEELFPKEFKDLLSLLKNANNEFVLLVGFTEDNKVLHFLLGKGGISSVRYTFSEDIISELKIKTFYLLHNHPFISEALPFPSEINLNKIAEFSTFPAFNGEIIIFQNYYIYIPPKKYTSEFLDKYNALINKLPSKEIFNFLKEKGLEHSAFKEIRELLESEGIEIKRFEPFKDIEVKEKVYSFNEIEDIAKFMSQFTINQKNIPILSLVDYKKDAFRVYNIFLSEKISLRDILRIVSSQRKLSFNGILINFPLYFVSEEQITSFLKEFRLLSRVFYIIQYDNFYNLQTNLPYVVYYLNPRLKEQNKTLYEKLKKDLISYEKMLVDKYFKAIPTLNEEQKKYYQSLNYLPYNHPEIINLLKIGNIIEVVNGYFKGLALIEDIDFQKKTITLNGLVFNLDDCLFKDISAIKTNFITLIKTGKVEQIFPLELQERFVEDLVNNYLREIEISDILPKRILMLIKINPVIYNELILSLRNRFSQFLNNIYTSLEKDIEYKTFSDFLEKHNLTIEQAIEELKKFIRGEASVFSVLKSKKNLYEKIGEYFYFVNKDIFALEKCPFCVKGFYIDEITKKKEKCPYCENGVINFDDLIIKKMIEKYFPEHTPQIIRDIVFSLRMTPEQIKALSLMLEKFKNQEVFDIKELQEKTGLKARELKDIWFAFINKFFIKDAFKEFAKILPLNYLQIIPRTELEVDTRFSEKEREKLLAFYDNKLLELPEDLIEKVFKFYIEDFSDYIFNTGYFENAQMILNNMDEENLKFLKEVFGITDKPNKIYARWWLWFVAHFHKLKSILSPPIFTALGRHIENAIYPIEFFTNYIKNTLLLALRDIEKYYNVLSKDLRKEVVRIWCKVIDNTDIYPEYLSTEKKVDIIKEELEKIGKQVDAETLKNIRGFVEACEKRFDLELRMLAAFLVKFRYNEIILGTFYSEKEFQERVEKEYEEIKKEFPPNYFPHFFPRGRYWIHTIKDGEHFVFTTNNPLEFDQMKRQLKELGYEIFSEIDFSSVRQISTFDLIEAIWILAGYNTLSKERQGVLIRAFEDTFLSFITQKDIRDKIRDLIFKEVGLTQFIKRRNIEGYLEETTENLIERLKERAIGLGNILGRGAYPTFLLQEYAESNISDIQLREDFLKIVEVYRKQSLEPLARFWGIFRFPVFLRYLGAKIAFYFVNSTQKILIPLYLLKVYGAKTSFSEFSRAIKFIFNFWGGYKDAVFSILKEEIPKGIPRIPRRLLTDAYRYTIEKINFKDEIEKFVFEKTFETGIWDITFAREYGFFNLGVFNYATAIAFIFAEMSEKENRMIASYMGIRPTIERVLGKKYEEVTLEEVKDRITDILKEIKTIVSKTQWNYSKYNRMPFTRNELIATFWALATWGFHFIHFVKELLSLDNTYFPYETKEVTTFQKIAKRILPAISILTIYQLLAAGLFGILEPIEPFIEIFLKIFGVDPYIIEKWKAQKIMNKGNWFSQTLYFGLPSHFGLSPYTFGAPGLIGTAFIQWIRRIADTVALFARGNLELRRLLEVFIPIPLTRLFSEWELPPHLSLDEKRVSIPPEQRRFLNQIRKYYDEIKVTKIEKKLWRKLGFPTMTSYELYVLSNLYRSIYYRYEYLYRKYNRALGEAIYKRDYERVKKLEEEMRKLGIQKSENIIENQIRREQQQERRVR